MLNNLIGFFGAFAQLKHSVRAAYGAFSVSRDVKIEVKDKQIRAKRKFEATESYTALGRVKVSIGPPLHDPRGMNAAVVTESGEITPELLTAAMRAAGGLPRDAMIDVAADADRYIRDDSQVALLVALLSTYYVLEYAKTGMAADLGVYDDGHIKVGMGTLVTGNVLHDTWLPTVRPAFEGWDQRTMCNPPLDPVLDLRKLKPDEARLLIAHLGGRRRTTNLAFDLEIPCLADKVLSANEPLNLAPAVVRVDTEPSLVRSTLDKYVEVNRLWGQFEAALAIMHQTALTPVPDTAEGLAWLKRGKTVHLPAFDALRGSYRVFLNDKAFGVSAAVTQTWKWWQSTGIATAVPAAMYNAVSLWGRYLVEASFYTEDADVAQLGNFKFGDAPSAAYYAYASLITGGDVYCAVPLNFGLQYDAWDEDNDYMIEMEATDLELTGYDVHIDGGTSKLKVSKVPPPCSPVTVLGRMPTDGAFTALSNHFTVDFDMVSQGWVVKNVDKAWCFGMAARWLGYDVEMTYDGKRRRANWASNASSTAARPFHVEGPDRTNVVINSITPRAKKWGQLPATGGDRNTWEVTVNVSDAVTVTALRGPRISTRGTFITKAASTTALFVPPDEGVQFVPVVMRAYSRAVVDQAGFAIVSQVTSHHPPDPIPLGPALEAEETTAALGGDDDTPAT
jgi:hypothetical protein